MGKNLGEGEFYYINIGNFAVETNKRLIHL